MWLESDNKVVHMRYFLMYQFLGGWLQLHDWTVADLRCERGHIARKPFDSGDQARGWKITRPMTHPA